MERVAGTRPSASTPSYATKARSSPFTKNQVPHGALNKSLRESKVQSNRRFIARPTDMWFEHYRHTQSLIMGSSSSPKRAEILSISKCQQYATHRNTQYIKVSIIRNPSTYYLVYQSTNSTPIIEIRNIPTYQQYVTDRNTMYRLVYIFSI